MTEPPAPERIAVIWSPEARADVRAIDRETAMQILHCVDRYLANRTGDVKKLKPPFTGFPPPLRRLPRVLRSKGREHHHDLRRPQPPRSLPLNPSNNRRTEIERHTGQTPDKARMLTGRDTFFGAAFFVAPKAQGLVSSLPQFPFFLSHFFLAGSNTGAERQPCQGRAVLARSSECSADP
jgi:hypothetical protein